MRSKAKADIEAFIENLRSLFPDVSIEVMREKWPSTDAWLRVKVTSPLDVDKVLRKAAELQNEWYLDRGVYILVSAADTGPLPV